MNRTNSTPTDRPAADSESAAQAGLSLSQDTRQFLEQLFAGLAETLRPGRDRSAEEEAAYLRGHLGIPDALQTRIGRRFPGWASNHVLIAVESVLRSDPYRVNEMVAFGHEGRVAPTFRAVAVTPDETREVLEEGWYAAFLGDVPLAVELCLEHDDESTLVVSVLLSSDHRELGLAFLSAVESYPNFYRGQVITVDEDGNPSFLAVPAVTVDDVVLEPTTWEELRRQVIDFVAMEPAFRAARLPFRRGVILAGPPGVGKTLVFRALTGHLAGRCTVLWLTSQAINNPADVARLFPFARSIAPTLMLLEDLDLIVRDRSWGRPAILGELLSQLDGPASSDGVIACASTNDASVLDEALSARPSRFDRIISFGLPSRETRIGMLQRFVGEVAHMHADLGWVAGQTAGLTGADLRELVVTAFAESQRDASADASKEASLETAHFARALDQLAKANAAARQAGVRVRRTARTGQFGFTRTLE